MYIGVWCIRIHNWRWESVIHEVGPEVQLGGGKEKEQVEIIETDRNV